MSKLGSKEWWGEELTAFQVCGQILHDTVGHEPVGVTVARSEEIKRDYDWLVWAVNRAERRYRDEAKPHCCN